MHNAGHMVFGPVEAFAPEQLGELYDRNVLSAQRVNRSALPHLRGQGTGLVVWISSSSARGGTPPFLAPYFAAKAAMDSLAVSYASELARAGIETSIIVPGAFTAGTNHFKNAGSPNDTARAAEYNTGAYLGFAAEIQQGLAAAVPPEADVVAVADAVVTVVNMPFGTRPFRTHIDPAQDGCEVVNTVADRVRAEFLRRIGLGDLLAPRKEERVRRKQPVVRGEPPASLWHPTCQAVIGKRFSDPFGSVLAGGLRMAAEPPSEGVASRLSTYPVAETIRRIEETARSKGLTVFVRIDHGGGARDVGLAMQEEQLLVFGNPRAGTPLMVARPLVGLELPLRVLVWQDPRGRVWVSYNESAFIAQRFGLPDGLEKNIAGVPALIEEALR